MHVWNLLSGEQIELREAGEKGAGIRRDVRYTLVVTDSALYVLMLSRPSV